MIRETRKQPNIKFALATVSAAAVAMVLGIVIISKLGDVLDGAKMVPVEFTITDVYRDIGWGEDWSTVVRNEHDVVVVLNGKLGNEGEIVMLSYPKAIVEKWKEPRQ